MKLNPNAIQTTKQARAYEFAKRVVERVDSVVDAVDSFDQSDSDYNKAAGSVLVDKVMIEPGDGAFNVRRWTDGATITRDGDRMEFRGKAQLPGSFGFLPTGLEANVSKTDTPDSTSYKIRYRDSLLSGPNTQIVEVNKSTGEWNVQTRWLGLIPGPIPKE